MRLLSVILAITAAAIALTAWLYRGGVSGSAGPEAASDEIRIEGAGNTLASLARQVGNPRVFAYDPVNRTATSHATLVIEGELQLGRPGDPASAEYLEMATEVCGDLRIEVRPSGTLRLDYSTIRTVSQVLSSTACSRGYALFVDGSLLMDHARISYLSGSTSQCLRQTARAMIRNSSFAYCDGNALSCYNVDGGRVTIENSEIMGSGNWALTVQGSGGAPLVVRDTVLDSHLGDVLLTGESAEVLLVDCVFDPRKIIFNRDSGRLTIQWTRRFMVIDRVSRRPVSGAVVRAEAKDRAGQVTAVEAPTDSKGIASLLLSERVVLPGQQTATAGPPMSYEILVRAADGTVARHPVSLAVHGKEAEPIVIEVK